jgi:peptide/nickel transport system permease protein
VATDLVEANVSWYTRTQDASRSLLTRLPPVSVVAGLVLLLHVIVALTGPLWVPYPPYKLLVGDASSPPSLAHWFGTDNYGRDVFSRVVAGEQSVLGLSVAGTSLALILGSLVGIVAGYIRGFIDDVLMRVVDVLNSIPPLIVALLIISSLGTGNLLLVLTVGFLYAPRVVRVVRAATLKVATEDFVTAARARGESIMSIARRELLPNVIGVVLVELSIRIGYTITFIGSLTLLGFGASPPDPAWGLMIGEGRANMLTAPWEALSPAIAMATLVVAINLFTDGLARMLLSQGEVGRGAGR